MLSLIGFVFFSDVFCANCLGGRFSENKNLIFFAISRTVLVVQRKSFAMILGSSPAVILVAMSSFSICVNRARRVNFTCSVLSFLIFFCLSLMSFPNQTAKEFRLAIYRLRPDMRPLQNHFRTFLDRFSSQQCNWLHALPPLPVSEIHLSFERTHERGDYRKQNNAGEWYCD